MMYNRFIKRKQSSPDGEPGRRRKRMKYRVEFRVYELEAAGAPEYFDFSGDGAEEAAPAEEWVNQECILVDTIRGNQVFRANRTAWRSQYSEGDWDALLRGKEVPSDFDEDGEPVEWETIHREEES